MSEFILHTNRLNSITEQSNRLPFFIHSVQPILLIKWIILADNVKNDLIYDFYKVSLLGLLVILTAEFPFVYMVGEGSMSMTFHFGSLAS